MWVDKTKLVRREILFLFASIYSSVGINIERYVSTSPTAVEIFHVLVIPAASAPQTAGRLE